MHPLREIQNLRKHGIMAGIPSWCTGNDLVIETCVERGAKLGVPVLIEATANQVNQFGGYTGQTPDQFYEKVVAMAKKTGLPADRLILGGDHLGPLIWQNLPEAEAMDRAEELVYRFAKAGYTKIHLDTSMKVADDPEGLLSTETIARRGARLYKAAMRGYEERKENHPDAVLPVFIIGSEVPIPGGAQEEEEGLSVTKPEAFEDTVSTYARCFAEAGIPDTAFGNVVAVVVQPGVEFGNDQIFAYNRDAAKKLCDHVKNVDGIDLEGHSTDYQPASCLKQMVEDGITILKVGPALTYYLREALFSLSFMEKELVAEEKQAKFPEVLDAVMVENPGNWKKYYHGDEKELLLQRRYGFSDRCRYYMTDARVLAAIEQLFANLREVNVSLSILHQYMPLQYPKVRDGILANDPKEWVKDYIGVVMDEYEKAAFPMLSES